MPPSKPYKGAHRKLVLAFDVGTTFSGIAYAILDPDDIPKIQGVTRYPSQENGDFKIPTVLYYTQDGKMRAAGAEAATPGMRLEAEDEDLIYVEWFKLHLRPDAMNDGISNNALHPLPPGKTVIDIFGDFLAYLFLCARRFITETHANGERLWESVGNRIDFVLSHPNGWEGSQQSKMRHAAVLGGLVPDTAAGRARVHFVTEGEASLHYCLDSGLAADVLKDGVNVMIVDAGGGTVDLSTYTIPTTSPISVEEIAPADCILQGSTRVNVRAADFLKVKLRNSKYGNDEDIKTMLESFEKSTKPTFKDPVERSFIRFGSMRDKDPNFGIRSGQLQLAGTDVADFFQPSVSGIIDAVRKQLIATSKSVPTAFLVGGFAASPWLFIKLQAALANLGIALCRPDNHTNKAVAEGAVSFFIEHFVSVRVAKVTYGSEVSCHFNEENQDHLIRRANVYSWPSGQLIVPEGFVMLLAKGSRLRENEEVFIRLYKEAAEAATLNHISSTVKCYRGNAANPQWIDIEPEMFSTLCTVHADTSQVYKAQKHGTKGAYYTQDFKIVLSCGLTEMMAQISWLENDQEKRGPAKIVYDDGAAAA